jgi:hypothetical protein
VEHAGNVDHRETVGVAEHLRDVARAVEQRQHPAERISGQYPVVPVAAEDHRAFVISPNAQIAAQARPLLGTPGCHCGRRYRTKMEAGGRFRNLAERQLI